VRAYWRRLGKPQHHVRAVVTQVSGDLQARLNQSQPFGYFVATVPGCLVAKQINVVGLDSSGKVIGKRRGAPSFAGFCRRRRMP
jgi:hypothetical protein